MKFGLGFGLNRNHFLGGGIVKKLKDAGAVLALLSNKADGSAPLTGNDSPWVDLSGNSNNGTLINFAGTAASGWNADSGENFITLDKIDDVIDFINTSSVDITTNDFVLAAVFKVTDRSTSGYIISKNEDSSTEQQYGLLSQSNGNVGFYLNGAVRTSFPLADDLWGSTLFEWDGADIRGYLNNVKTGAEPAFVGPLISESNLQVGARSASVDGTIKTLFFGGDIAAIALFHKDTLDFEKIRELWHKDIAMRYLALNP